MSEAAGNRRDRRLGHIDRAGVDADAAIGRSGGGTERSVGIVDLRQDIVGCPVVILPHDDPAAVRQADDIGTGLIAGRRGRAGLLGNEDLRAEQRAVRVDHLRPDLEIPGAERLVSPHRHRSAADRARRPRDRSAWPWRSC